MSNIVKFVVIFLILYSSSRLVSCVEDFVLLKPADIVIDQERLNGYEPEGKLIQEMTLQMAETFVAPRFGVTDLHKVGQGGFAQVFKARDSNDQVYAIKIQSASNNDYQTLAESYETWLQEVLAMKITAGHPNFVQLHEVKYLKHRSAVARIPTHVAMKMEFLSASVFELVMMNNASFRGEPQLHNLLWQHLKAISFLHSKGMVHQDIKPPNSMVATPYDKTQLRAMSTQALQKVLSSVTIKVIDMGYAELMPVPKSTSMSGTLEFMSPEKFEAAAENSQRGRDVISFDPFPADVYAVGCIAVHAAAPAVFDEFVRGYDDDFELLGDVLQLGIEAGKLDYLKGSQVLKVIRGLVEPNPRIRLTAEQALKLLKD